MTAREDRTNRTTALLRNPDFETFQPYCWGIAASTELRVVVVAQSSVPGEFLTVLALPSSTSWAGPLQTLLTIGKEVLGDRFCVLSHGLGNIRRTTGSLAFGTLLPHGEAGQDLLLVTYGEMGTVHIVDIMQRKHVGNVSPVGRCLPTPHGVATRGTRVAVSTREPDAVWVLDRTGSISDWTVMHVMTPVKNDTLALVWLPLGLRFSSDGSSIVVADSLGGRLHKFATSDGASRGTFGTHVNCCRDVMEVQGGWLVAGVTTVPFIFVEDACSTSPELPGIMPHPESEDNFTLAYHSMTCVPGLGVLAITQLSHFITAYSTLDDMAMGRMSVERVAWLDAVAKAVRRRSSVASASGR